MRASSVPLGILTAAFGLFAAFLLFTPFRGQAFGEQPIGAFRAFYCGGAVVRAGGDPYRTEPLRSCERALPGYADYGVGGIVEPVPLPGYALAPLSLLSLLPFQAAFITFSVLSVIATLGAVFALARLTGLTPLLVGAALLLGDLFHNLIFGEIPPLVIGALAFAGLFVSRKRYWAATAALGAALIEPHVVLPAVAAAGVALPAMRRPMLVLAAVLLALTFAVSGLHGTLEYVTRVLPVQAAAELPAIDQYSFSWLLNFLGAGDRVALAFGSLSYVFSAVLGAVLAMSLARRFAEPAFLVLFPPAIAMIGGSFLHDIQIPIAEPAALLLLARVPFARAWSMLAVLLLAIPWSALDAIIELSAPLVAAIVVWESGLLGEPARRAALACAAALAAFALLRALQHLDARAFRPAAPPPASIARAGDAGENASENWFRYVRVSGYGTSSPQSLAEKLPLWGGLLVLAGVGIGARGTRSLASRRKSP